MKKKYIIHLWVLLSMCCGVRCTAQMLNGHPISSMAEIGHGPCRDTLHILRAEHEYDIGVILPSWPAVLSDDYVAVMEGTVVYNDRTGGNGPEVSYEDLPFYHYTHDLNIDIKPDSTADGRYTNLLPYLVYEHEHGIKDTVLRRTMHVEWESGLGSVNYINPCHKLNDAGKSCGFCSGGHERGDIIWNWPTIGDWMHVEGQYVWDRGHPPATTEIHPARMILTRRGLPELITVGDSSVKYATRVDVYASGDGGAIRNNRKDVPKFVSPVHMGSKDYVVTVRIELPKPSVGSVLKYITKRRPGDTFVPMDSVLCDNNGTARIVIPWQSRGAADQAIYARTIYLYWDEGNGTRADYVIDEYIVSMTKLRFDKLSEVDGRAEVRLFANVGSDWIFMNDYHGKHERILSKGMGKTWRKNWDLNNQFKIYMPRDKCFRVFMSGWETDGVDLLMGDIIDPSSPCDKRTKRMLKRKLFSIKNMLLAGCMDDQYGEISNIHRYNALSDQNYFVASPKEGINEDPCPFSKYPLKDRYFLTYTIQRK